MPLPRFPIIVGPTAGGKSALAVGLALELERRGMPRGEVVSADAFMVYRGMDIGTAKPGQAERRGVLHHLIDVREPTEPFTVHEWLAEAQRLIGQIRGRGALPIVAGGTHLYAKALLDGLFEGPPPDPALRGALQALGPVRLREELLSVDPAAAARIHPRDIRRTVRALEVHRLTGRPISEHQSQWDSGPRDDARLVWLDWPAEAINPRINARVREMIAAGLVEEVRALHGAERLGPQAREALGYKQVLEHIEGGLGLDHAVERIKIQTRRLAKNQRTWLRRLAASSPDAVRVGPEMIENGSWIDRVLGALG